MDYFANDLRRAMRAFRSNAVLAITATLTLAVCIAANTTVFSLVDSILLRPLPYPDSQRLYWIGERMGRDQREVAIASDYYSLRDKNRVFEHVAAYQSTTLNWARAERPEQIQVAQVTPSFFRVFDTPPLMGRYLAPEERGSKAPPVVVLSYAFWRGRFGSNPKIIGKTVRLSGATEGAGESYAATVIGVMPQGFDYPKGALLWTPLPLDEATERARSPRRPMHLISIVARLKPGVAAPQLDTEMQRLTSSIRSEYPKEFQASGLLKHMRIAATPLRERMTGNIRPALMVLSAAVLLVLLIACVNLANLLLARAVSRRRELAVCLALGSGRVRIARRVLIESLALALPGAAVGAAIAYFAVRLLNFAKPLALQNYPPISLDVRALGFTFGLAVITALIFGAAPAITSAGVNIQDALKSAGALHTGSRRTARLRKALVVAELSISLVLMIGAALLARSFLKLSQVPLGFVSQDVLTLRTNLTGSRYASAQMQTQFYDQVLERLNRLPMVQAAAVASDIPLSGPLGMMRFQIAGRLPVPIAQQPSAGFSIVSRDYFRTLRIPLRRGRWFDSRDTTRTADTAIINEVLAQKFFPGEDPVGRRIIYGPDQAQWLIAGVAGNISEADLGAEPQPLIYRCNCQVQDPFFSRMAVVVRTTGDPHAAVRAVEDQFYAVDRNEPVFDIRTMEERLHDSLAPRRFQLALIGTFAAIAMILAALGVYGVMSYVVASRTREIGIHMALGARPRQVSFLVMSETLVLVIAAACIGAIAAAGLTRYLQSMLYGVTPLDAISFALMPVVLVLIALLASFAPAQRASAIDPITALREE